VQTQAAPASPTASSIVFDLMHPGFIVPIVVAGVLALIVVALVIILCICWTEQRHRATKFQKKDSSQPASAIADASQVHVEMQPSQLERSPAVRSDRLPDHYNPMLQGHSAGSPLLKPPYPSVDASRRPPQNSSAGKSGELNTVAAATDNVPAAGTIGGGTSRGGVSFSGRPMPRQTSIRLA
jgi:hypothetical protein